MRFILLITPHVVSAGVRAETSWLCGMKSPYPQADQAKGLFASFFVLFSFKQRKKDIVPPYQREKSHKKPRRQTEKKQTVPFFKRAFSKSPVSRQRKINPSPLFTTTPIPTVLPTNRGAQSPYGSRAVVRVMRLGTHPRHQIESALSLNR